MIGQSVVQTGSRKVSSTTLPRRPASDTWRPSWLVRVKFGAGVSSWPDAPAMASATIGSASWLTEANAIGAAPTRITAIAASATAARVHRGGLGRGGVRRSLVDGRGAFLGSADGLGAGRRGGAGRHLLRRGAGHGLGGGLPTLGSRDGGPLSGDGW